MSGGVFQRHDQDGVTRMACAVSRIVLVSLIFVDREMRDTKLDFYYRYNRTAAQMFSHIPIKKNK